MVVGVAVGVVTVAAAAAAAATAIAIADELCCRRVLTKYKIALYNGELQHAALRFPFAAISPAYRDQDNPAIKQVSATNLATNLRETISAINVAWEIHKTSTGIHQRNRGRCAMK